MSHLETWGKTWNHESFHYPDWVMDRWSREFSIGKAVLDSTKTPNVYQLRMNGVRIGDDFEAHNVYVLWRTVSLRIISLLQLQQKRIVDELEEVEK